MLRLELYTTNMLYKMNLYKICFYGCKSNVKLTTVSVVNFVHHKSTIVKPEELQLPNDKKQWNVPVGFNTGARIYNCIAKTNVPLILQNKNFVSWYMCGPTVYDSAHIGHACCYMKFDIIRRILTNFLGVNLVMVMGITDIDDKIIDKAREHNTDIKKIASQYEAEFFQDIKDLSITPPTLSARVSDYIPGIISFVQKIIDAGFAYVTDDGSVYFDTSHYPQYGKLSSQASEENRTPRPEKRSPTDFALWKGAKPGEPWWNSPWGVGKGRPGWHIECSAIASELFGRNIDIHSGGIDLIFPHHENEEAQCCAYHNVPQWVNYWMHSGHLYLKGSEKMSKSLKNTISIQEFLKSFTANQFRMLCLLSPYRNNIEYTDSTMENAVAVLKKIESFLDDCEAYISGYKAGAIDESEWMQALSETREKFSASLLDDFDTAKGMNAVVQFITKGNRMLKTEPSNNEHSRSPAVVAAAVNHIRHIMQLLGVTILRKDEVLKTEADAVPVKVDEILDCMLQFRSTVRETALQRSLDGKNSDASEKNEVLLKACDSLRESLSAAGVQLKDHGKMSSWSLVGGNRKKK